MALKFDATGLVPAIIQDDRTGDVLTLFYMNDDTVRKTVETGQVWRYSRQHQQLMLKGATSGDYLNVRRVLFDCDADALVVRVVPTGAACHTGEATCFFREITQGTTDDDIVAV